MKIYKLHNAADAFTRLRQTTGWKPAPQHAKSQNDS